MPRTRRIVVPGAPHHVYMRGNNRRRLFSSHDDRMHFLSCLSRALRISACRLHQLTLMNNHVHLIIAPPTREALSSFVARTCQRYAQVRNAARDASGKLFEERFHSKPILDEAAVMTTTLYNDANGYRAGLSKSPFGHEWSTGPLHAGADGRIPSSLWTPSSWYRRLGLDDAARAGRYRELMLAYVSRNGVGRAEHRPHEVPERRYRLRLERPDRSYARELFSRWGEKSE